LGTTEIQKGSNQVDTPITIEQAQALANWVVASGKNLTTVYATHGHGDHFFGTSTVLERFPRARFVARPEVNAAYNGDHLHLSESPDQQKRREWIAALDRMESLEPRAVIAGHQRVGNDDSPRIIGGTRKYIRDFERLATQTTTARELYDEMLKLYPDWINRGALWSSVLAVKS
jgi:hypothetical protein